MRSRRRWSAPCSCAAKPVTCTTCFLLRKGVAVDSDVVEAKLGGWKKGMAFRPDEVGSRIDRIGATWRGDLEPLLGQVPPFEAVAGEVRSRLRKVHADRD